jgi:hypothetical protein
VDLFLFWRVKEELTDLSLGKDSFKETLVGVIRTFTSEKFAAATRNVLNAGKSAFELT